MLRLLQSPAAAEADAGLAPRPSARRPRPLRALLLGLVPLPLLEVVGAVCVVFPLLPPELVLLLLSRPPDPLFLRALPPPAGLPSPSPAGAAGGSRS